MLTKTLLVVLLATTLCHLSEQKPPRRLLKTGQTAESEPDYSGCDNTYQCFGIPDDCHENKACDVLLKTKPADSGADFQLFWKRPEDSNDSYVAAALSDDQKMGDDSVTIFSLPDKKSAVESQGITVGHKGVTLVNVTGVDNVKVKYENGLLVGSWHRAESTQVEKKTFNLKDNKYYILQAYGPLNDKGDVKHHAARSVSKVAVSLEQAQTTPTTKQPTQAPTTKSASSSSAGSTQASTVTKVASTATTPAATTSGGNTTVTTEPTTRSGNETTTPSGEHSTTPATTQSSGSGSLIQSLGLAIIGLFLALH